MRLLFLGTAAAEAYPAAFCGCEHCEQARRSRGLDLRHRSSLLVDDDLLIDLGPDVIPAALAYSLRLHRLRTVLITHAHADHFDPDVLRWRRPGFRVGELAELALYGPAEMVRAVEAMEHFEEIAVRPVAVEPGAHFAAENVEVWALPAVHGTDAPLIYVAARHGIKFLYACDTGALPEQVWGALAAHELDAIIMEETMGSAQSQWHMNLEGIGQHRARAEKEGILKPGGRFIATHFSHRNNPSHVELAALLQKSRVEAAYDGMEVTL
jgi:phosphoribosyl 1,2-cyclic phosphate phosphodiesterase